MLSASACFVMTIINWGGVLVSLFVYLFFNTSNTFQNACTAPDIKVMRPCYYVQTSGILQVIRVNLKIRINHEFMISGNLVCVVLFPFDDCNYTDGLIGLLYHR